MDAILLVEMELVSIVLMTKSCHATCLRLVETVSTSNRSMDGWMDGWMEEAMNE